MNGVFMNLSVFLNSLTSGSLDDRLSRLYGNTLRHKARYISAAENFSKLYPLCDDIRVFSVPATIGMIGRMYGSRAGVSLNAAIASDAIVFAALNDDGVIKVVTDRGGSAEFPADDLYIRPEEDGSLSGTVKTIAGSFDVTSGFSCFISSELHGDDDKRTLAVLLTKIMDAFFNDGKFTDSELAAIAAKSCPGMESLIAAGIKGGFSLIEGSRASAVGFDMASGGYTLCMINAGLPLEEITAAAASKIAGAVSVDSFGSIREDDIIVNISELRKICTESEILSALHFAAENRRAADAAEMLRTGDTEEFFAIMNEMPEVIPSPETCLAYMTTKKLLGGCGCVKLSESGKLIVFVPNYMTLDFIEQIHTVFGTGVCTAAKTRVIGLCEIEA